MSSAGSAGDRRRVLVAAAIQARPQKYWLAMEAIQQPMAPYRGISSRFRARFIATDSSMILVNWLKLELAVSADP